MKKILFYFIICPLLSPAQGVMKIMPGASVKGSGDVNITLANVEIDNKGTVTDQTSFRLAGNQTTSIGGTGSTNVNRVTVAKSGNAMTVLQSNITVNNEFVFSGGLLDLGNYTIDLGSTGKLMNESPASRAFTNGSGYIQAIAQLNQPSAINPGNLGAVITSDKNLGLTVVRRGHQVYQNVNGNYPSIARYYDINPQFNIALKATLMFFYFDEELNGQEESLLDQYKSKNPTEKGLYQLGFLD